VHLTSKIADVRTATLGLLVLAAVGCASRPQLRERVGRIAFEGNGSFWDGTSDFHVRQAMEQERGAWSTPLFPRLAVPLDRETLAHDAWRIELWYAHNGYLDARFLGWDVSERRRARWPAWDLLARMRRPAIMDITGLVDEGPPSVVRELRFEGLDLGGGTVHRRHIERNSSVQPGDRFSLEAVDDTEALIRGWLQEHSYAWVQVRSEVKAYPEERAVDVVFRVEPGVACTFGDVEIEGADHVPEVHVRDQLAMRPGRPYKASVLGETRRDLFELGTFSVVRVSPVRQPDDPATVPVRVELSEARFRRLRLGGGLGAESGQQDAHVSVGLLHTNLFERLIQLDLDTELGAAAIATYDSLSEGEVERWAPVVDSGLELRFPRIFGPGWVMTQAVDYEMGLESSYTFYQPSWAPSVSRSFEPRKGTRKALGEVTFTTAYRLSYFDFLEQTVDLSSIESSRMGLDLAAPYFLSYAEEALVWDLRDDPLFTTRGMYLSGAVGMAGGPVGGGAPLFGEFDFVKVQHDLRMYNSLAPLLRLEGGLVLATRLAGGFAHPIGGGDRASVPYAERFLLGGGSSVRGWVSDHLGPRLCVVDGVYVTVSDGVACDAETAVLPIGGEVYALGTVELRKPLLWDISAVGFLDIGMAWNDWAEMMEQPPLPAAGVGLRYKSPVGPVRLDVGFRLDDDADFADEPPLNVHFSLSEAF
jgi:outer membrane protein assembly factor BamA